MLALTKRLGAAALAGAVACALAVPPVSAQPVYVPTSQRGLINPFNRLSTGMALNQWAYNASLVGRNYNALTYGTGLNPYAPYGTNPAANLFAATTAAINNPFIYPSVVVSGGAPGYGGGVTAPYYPAYGGYGGYPYGGGYGGGAIAGGTATMTSSASPYGAGAVESGLTGPQITSVPSSPYGAYSNPYIPPNYGDPLSGYLTGAANVYNAQGQYQMNYQTSRLIRERVRQAQVETQRRIFDEWAYERANTPSLEDLREKNIRTAERRAQYQPPVTEIVNGDSLNTLLNKLKSSKRPSDEFSVKLPAEAVRQVNVSTGSASGGLGAIKQIKEGAPINWPLVVQGNDFEKDRTALDNQLPKVVNSAATGGRVDAGAMNDIKAALGRMQTRLDENVGDLEPGQYIVAKRFLNQLGQAYKVLQQPDVDKYFNKLDDSVKTVGDLVRVMRDKGLQFAPAANGDEAAYMALWQALSNAASQATPPAEKSEK